MHILLLRKHSYIWLAKQEGEAEQFDRAVSYLERALQLDPGKQTLVALDHIGLASQRQVEEAAQFDRAVSYLEQALQVENRNWWR